MRAIRKLGILGGTFDPVHCGHVHFALAFRDALAAANDDSSLKLIPCHIPPHRDAPQVSARDRCEMLRLAFAGTPGVEIDTREIDADAISYTVDTLSSLRADYPDALLILAIGADAFAGFTRWHRWEDVLNLASVVVCTRPGSEIDEQNELLRDRQVTLEQLETSGQIAVLDINPLDISSTLIRNGVRDRVDLSTLLPTSVTQYIERHGLYLS
ncbi:MAG: nicotinate-nucleotide adenylyltransferase [Pseudomonadota bacterium]